MKYIIAFIGMLVGQLMGRLIADSQLIGWTFGAILFAIGYQVPAFISYSRASPKQLLSFHGPHSPISRSKSSGELRAILSQLFDGGLLLDFDSKNGCATVDEAGWLTLTPPEKTTLVQILTQAQSVDGNPRSEIRILNREKGVLERFGVAEVLKHARGGES